MPTAFGTTFGSMECDKELGINPRALLQEVRFFLSILKIGFYNTNTVDSF